MRIYTANGRNYNVDKMIKWVKNLRSKRVKLLDVHHHKVWTIAGTKVSPARVLSNPQTYKTHYNRIMKADLRHPIILDRQGRRVIDGIHRLTKARHLGLTYIRAYILDSIEQFAL